MSYLKGLLLLRDLEKETSRSQTVSHTPMTERSYTFELHGRMDLEISFDGKVLRTPIYIKMDAHDQLLLAEGVCSQLGIVEYHHNVWPGKKEVDSGQPGPCVRDGGMVLSVRQVRVLRETTVPARKAVWMDVVVEGTKSQKGPLLLEEYCDNTGGTRLEIQGSLFKANEKGEATLMILNTSGFTGKISKGTVVGEAVEVRMSSRVFRQDRLQCWKQGEH